MRLLLKYYTENNLYFCYFFLSKCPLEIKVYKGGRSRIVFFRVIKLCVNHLQALQ